MKRNGTEMYALAVCFVAMTCIGVTSVFAVYNVLGLAMPALTINPRTSGFYESNEAYLPIMGRDKPVLSVSELTAKREADYQHELDSERRDRARELMVIFIILSVASVMFISHWRLHQRAKAAAVVA